MTHRERHVETLLFGNPDRIPFSPGGPRQSTRERWHAEGLPEGQDYMDAIYALLDGERAQKGLPPGDWRPKQPGTDPGVSFRMIPTFEEKVLEHKDGHYIVQDWMGAITEISDEFDYTYIRNAIDFVTRKWHKFPVENRKDWEAMKWRFNPDDPERYVKSIYERYRRLSQQSGEEPFSYVYFYTNLSYLQSLGLILLISTKVRRAYTNRVQLLFSGELFQAVWKSRFG